MSLKKRLKETIETFESLGVIIDVMETGGKHIKFWVRKGKNKKLFISSATPTDGRGPLNFKGDVKRWLKSLETGENDGYESDRKSP